MLVAEGQGSKGFREQGHIWLMLIITGVPQDSVLEPVLFNTFISALEGAGECTISVSLMIIPDWEVLVIILGGMIDLA